MVIAKFFFLQVTVILAIEKIIGRLKDNDKTIFPPNYCPTLNRKGIRKTDGSWHTVSDRPIWKFSLNRYPYRYDHYI